jgi:metal-responsive CopG/Arc/MetJ family transcriptional regulator
MKLLVIDMEKKKLGRPPIAERKDKNIKVRLTEQMYNQLDKYCKESGDTKTETVRQALRQFLKYNS